MRIIEHADTPYQFTLAAEQSVTIDDSSGQLSVKDGGRGDVETQNQGNDVDSRCQSESKPLPHEPMCAGCFACTNCISNVTTRL